MLIPNYKKITKNCEDSTLERTFNFLTSLKFFFKHQLIAHLLKCHYCIMTEKLILMLSKKTKANRSDIFVLKATENRYFWSPDLLASVIIRLICLAPQNTRYHKYSSLHLSSLYMPSALLYVTRINYGQISRKTFQTAQQVGHTGLFPHTAQLLPSFTSCFPHDETHHTPCIFNCVCFSLSLLLKTLNRPLV